MSSIAALVERFTRLFIAGLLICDTLSEDRARLQLEQLCEEAGAKPILIVETPFSVGA
ncbi:hypothetical protein [Rhizobium sp. R339]|uniref:hypothetical protein n=1 Tax=Rhizobium sp. R339 TaxID=1764273 RepID=UPI00167C65D2|nr:hypothetical protein [Rhizobium sp. R339]